MPSSRIARLAVPIIVVLVVLMMVVPLLVDLVLTRKAQIKGRKKMSIESFLL